MTKRLIAHHHETGMPIPGVIEITELNGNMVAIKVKDRCTREHRQSELIICLDDWDELRQQIIANG